MSDQTHMRIGAIGGLFAAIVCCTTPLLIVALGSLGISAWLANAYYVLIPALAIFLGLAALRHYRRRAPSQSCCDPVSPKQGIKS